MFKLKNNANLKLKNYTKVDLNPKKKILNFNLIKKY